MAFLQMLHYSPCVRQNLLLNIIIPDPDTKNSIPVRQRKLLYLLHGLSESDDASAWQRFTAIETHARQYGLVVVMPSAGRSFYSDQPNGQAYFTYLTEELPAYLADVFHLKPKREDTFIAGNSMGGYGAIKAAMLKPELYHAAGSFSGVLSLVMLNNPEDPRRHEFELLFGDLRELPDSQHDPAFWLRNAANNPQYNPKLYISCGRQDDLYPLSLYFHEGCSSVRLDVSYYEEDGIHDWFFWDRQILQFIDWALATENNLKINRNGDHHDQ